MTTTKKTGRPKVYASTEERNAARAARAKEAFDKMTEAEKEVLRQRQRDSRNKRKTERPEDYKQMIADKVEKNRIAYQTDPEKRAHIREYQREYYKKKD